MNNRKTEANAKDEKLKQSPTQTNTERKKNRVILVRKAKDRMNPKILIVLINYYA